MTGVVWLLDLFAKNAVSTQDATEVDEHLDDPTDPEKEENFVGPAHGGRKPPAQTPIQEAAINVQRVETMLNGQESGYHCVQPQLILDSILWILFL